MKEFGKMNFYTTTELAEKLKMNVQVVTRKLQSGEIEGFKMGKDWRIEEEAIQKWLKKISNQGRQLTPKEKVLGNFIRDGRLTVMPAQRKKRTYILEHILLSFEINRTYEEAEVNEIIKGIFEDYCFVRREMVDEKMMYRKDGKYRRNAAYLFSDRPLAK